MSKSSSGIEFFTLKNMKIIIGFLLCCFSLGATAQQQQALDGNWVKSSIDAYERVNVTRNGTTEDAMDSIAFVSYVRGILSVHRQNNLMASLLVAALNDTKKTSKTAVAGKQIDNQMRVAFAFIPLLRIPDTLSTQQVVAIVRKYLEENPEKWNTDASLLITSALETAFSKK